MYPPDIAEHAPDRTAYVMAGSGHSLTFGELDERSNRCAHALGDLGVVPGDALVVLLPNGPAWPVVVAAGMRSGLQVVPVNWHLGTAELVPLLTDAAPAAIVTCGELLPGLLAALDAVPATPHVLVVDGPADGALDLEDLLAAAPATPIARELLGARVLFSGGTTGRPKAYRQPLLGVHPREAPKRHPHLAERLGIEANIRFLSPAPSYHAAPFTFQLMTLGVGGTVVCLESFDAVRAIEAIGRHEVTHSQWVPTMLSRLLAVPEEQRGGRAPSHRVAVTSGAPCPPELKDAVTAWWGPILHEYYGASEGYGHTYISPAEAAERRGSVGRPLGATRVVITDEDGAPAPTGAVGRVCFGAEPDAPLRGMGDMGRLDDDGYLYLTGRATFMIVSGGVNIYPEEIEAVVGAMPQIADVAVFGVPHPDFGEQVMAVVEPAADADPTTLGEEVVAHCRARLAGFKAPRLVEIVERLPRLETGKLDKRALRAQYVAEG